VSAMFLFCSIPVLDRHVKGAAKNNPKVGVACARYPNSSAMVDAVLMPVPEIT